MKKILFLIVFAFLSSTFFSQVDFKKGSLADMFQMAKDQKKILMVDVMTDWCKWCIELDHKVYSKPEMYEFANANQINYKIDAEKGEGVEFAKKYGIKGYPSVLFLNADGSEIDRIYGYVPLNDFVQMMKDYNNGVNTMSDLKHKLDVNPDDIVSNLRMGEKLISIGENEKTKQYLNKVIDIDPQNLSGKVPDAKYDLATLSDKDHMVQNLKDFIQNYPQSDKVKDAYINLAESYFTSDKESAEKIYSEALSKYSDYDMLRSSYGQYLNAIAVGIASDSSKSNDDLKNALTIIDKALPYVEGSVNEASSYYIQAALLYRLKDYSNASVSIDKALKIFDRKLYRDLKDKINKSL